MPRMRYKTRSCEPIWPFHAFEGRSNVYTWLTRIAVNSALMILRRRRARPGNVV